MALDLNQKQFDFEVYDTNKQLVYAMHGTPMELVEAMNWNQSKIDWFTGYGNESD